MDKNTRDTIFKAFRDGKITEEQMIQMFKNAAKFREENK